MLSVTSNLHDDANNVLNYTGQAHAQVKKVFENQQKTDLNLIKIIIKNSTSNQNQN